MNNQKGFTLIELLVVLIIIGVLASVGVPKYFRSVERSRASEAISMLSAIAQAQDRYRQRNGNYSTTGQALDVDIVAGRFFLAPVGISQNIAQMQRNAAMEGGTTGWPTGCTNAYFMTVNFNSGGIPGNRNWNNSNINCAFVWP
ncbi:MAG: prepilin-type N-terminal cleavage/methylation domain-containing protein [Elusimicrobia bacterium]|nr:prepilin-type N-terminal cleavage/methylation domain-containing protein [Elusimicrobiota bacterium]